MYRSLNGDIGGDIWHQVLYVSMHAFLLVANLDTFGQGILNDMQRLVAYTQERRLVSLRNTRDIELDDLDELPERMRMGSVANEFKYDVNESAFVVRAIVRYAWRAMLPIYIVEAILGIAVVATSLLNTRILHFLDMPAAYTWHGGYSILFLGLFADILVKQFGRIKVYLEGESDRVIQALNLELFRLPLTNAGLRKERTISEARSAATEIRYCIGDLQPVIGKLAGIISVIVAIYSYIGWFVLVPALVEVTMISIEWLMKRYLGHEFDWRPVSTSHTFSANVEEIFRNIKAIKMFGWERVYADPELQKHWQSEENVGGILPWYAPIVRLSWKLFSYVSMVTTELSVYLAVHLYTATSAGSTHAISSADMFQLDMLIRDLNKIYESVKWRYGSFTALIYQTYTLEKALKGDFVSSLPRYPLGSVEGEKELDSPKPSVTLEDCDFSLVTDEAVLEDISFNAQDGELVAVVGKTGTGKSSLLLSICGEVEETKGTGAVFGTIAFMEQAPVIINDTIRENILFGRKYDKEHYNQVIEACALTEDINAWKKGDRTVIGDRGIKISGGQRARLALARTIYSKADIYVLDDPLSAVDAHVKRHILDNVIMDSGLLGGKLRILTVSSEKLLPYFNQVIRLDQGKAAVTKQVPQIYQPLTTAISDVKDINDMTVVLEIPRKFHSINKGIDILRHYTGMERDGGPDEDTVEPPSNWLSSGKIELRNFSMKYHEDLEYVLKNISLTINPGERIGIVGRTGAGKTSLCRAIFRLANKKTCEGSILIDGYDISTIRISDLRPKLGTIPQESTMFTGSFKQNLDPLMEYTIEDMWAALIKCNMVELVEPKRDRTRDRSIGSYSDYYESIKRDIADWDEEWQRSSWMKRIFLWMYVAKPKLPSGGNPKEIYGLGKSIGDYNRFSDGQRQLFSLCRLLMRKRKIIVLDEATADVDLETDKEMQKLFRSEFRDSTVLTIAHRLETIMNSDKIIVMDKGRVVEFGPPKDLIDQGGYFSELVKANEF
ncbi:hypothetical protein IWW48_005570 [Coemansia sp. RSA 1200]|nr:hypothetical protein IWW48_005570 [Coemansia sp. RSA 1200]